VSRLLIAPVEALTDRELTDTERRVLLILFSFRGKTTNNVWPSTEAIAEMANISDVPRISKITSGLAKKGWLTKKKKGFTGCNEYTLTVPDRLEVDPNLANFTNLEESANLEENNNTNLANFTKSNLANSAKYKEQTNEQTNEQTIKKTKAKKTDLDYSVWPSAPDQQILDDWIAMRKRHKADVSQTVINAFAVEFRKAASFGFTVGDCLSESITRNWRGFKAEWLTNAGVQPRGGTTKQSAATLGFTSNDYNNGINPDGSF
jgi:hypothetical protein